MVFGAIGLVDTAGRCSGQCSSGNAGGGDTRTTIIITSMPPRPTERARPDTAQTTACPPANAVKRRRSRHATTARATRRSLKPAACRPSARKTRPNPSPDPCKRAGRSRGRARRIWRWRSCCCPRPSGTACPPSMPSAARWMTWPTTRPSRSSSAASNWPPGGPMSAAPAARRRRISPSTASCSRSSANTICPSNISTPCCKAWRWTSTSSATRTTSNWNSTAIASPRSSAC